MLPSQELELIVKKQAVTVARVAKDLFSELISVTPVAQKNGGSLKGAWDIKKTSSGWRISNNLLYASVIFEGRRFVYSPSYPNGRYEGSKQLKVSNNIYVILKKYDRIMQRELNKI